MSEKKPFNKEIASGLWKHVQVTIDRFTPKLKRYAKSDFLGFAVITLTIPALPGFSLTLTGLQVKLLNDQPRLDMKQELGSDKKYHDVYFPRSAEIRQVLTLRTFKHPEVIAAIEAIQQLPKPGATMAAAEGDDPFAGTTSDDSPF
jgi:hypothetical protein